MNFVLRIAKFNVAAGRSDVATLERHPAAYASRLTRMNTVEITSESTNINPGRKSPSLTLTEHFMDPLRLLFRYPRLSKSLPLALGIGMGVVWYLNREPSPEAESADTPEVKLAEVGIPEPSLDDFSEEVQLAIIDAQKEVAASPTSEKWRDYGQILLAFQMEPEARHCFEKAVGLDPLDAKA